jgi:hypothetical protein
MSRIPRIAHFVFGLREQTEPFHLLHYLSIETCRHHLRPEAIHFHYHHLPYGVFWEAVRPHLTLHRVGLAPDVMAADYDPDLVPERYLYAHHADFVRLDALIARGGVYADIDTIFLRPLPDAFFEAPFVIGREADTADERTGERKPSLCNALLLAEPGSAFAREWRGRMAGALNGTWSNHSCFLPQTIRDEMPEAVRVEPEASFYPVPSTPAGLSALLDDEAEGPPPDLSRAWSVHLWAHLWWDRLRTDYSRRHAGEMTLERLRRSRAPLAEIVRPHLPAIELEDLEG